MAAEVEVIGTFTDNASGGLSGFGSSLGNLGSIVSGIRDAFDLVSGAIQGAVGFVQPFIDSAAESEMAVARLDGVLRATGGAVGLSSQQLQDMANSLQNVTMFSDETILAGESMLLTFRNIGAETFQRTVPAMLDMASIFGSVDSAALQLGKALNDPLTGISALQRVGVTFSDQQREQIANFMEMGDIASAQGIILSELEAQVGGLAETMGQTFSGRLEILNNRFDSLRETIGGAFIPILEGFLDMVESAIPRLEIFAGALANAITTGDFSAIFNMFEDGTSYLGGFIEMLGVGQEQAEQFASAIFELLDFNVTPLGELLTEMVSNIDWQGLSQSIADGLDSVDWGHVGNVIAEGLGHIAIIIGTVLSEIDWGRLLNSFANAFSDFMAGLFGFIDWEDMISNAEIGFRYVGTQIVDALRSGLLAAWTNFTNLPNLLFNNFIASVKAVLGISSPSAVFADIGRDIVLGLTGGFLAYWDDLIRIATTSLDNFLNLFGIDLSFGGSSASGLGTAGGGTAPDGSTTTGGQTVINIYGASYWGVGGPGDVDCVSPHPLVAASGNQLVTSGF